MEKIPCRCDCATSCPFLQPDGSGNIDGGQRLTCPDRLERKREALHYVGMDRQLMARAATARIRKARN